MAAMFVKHRTNRRAGAERNRRKWACRIAVESLESRSLLSGNMVIRWNQILLDAVRVARTPPPLATRNMAMVQVAVYDSVDAIDRSYEVYRVAAKTPRSASPQAAVAAAAHRVLVQLYPAQAATFDAALVSSLAGIPDRPSREKGVRLGVSVADAILDWRSHDGANAVVADTPGTYPGAWQPTPPSYAPALLPQWPEVTPFAMTSGSQFRPPGQPAMESTAYTTAFNEVKDLGAVDSTTRTADQTQIALFWADGAGTATPPGHWNAIAAQVAEQRGTSLVETARLFALLDIAEADAGIVAWDAKYVDNCWRPITAIRQADSDGNAQTIADLIWTPLLVTPPFPSYVSGHSTFSGAAAEVLTSYFGPHVGFTTTSDSLPGVTRSFHSFAEAANEAGQSRIYGGIHFQFDNVDGLAAGRALGDYVSRNFLSPRKHHSRSEASDGHPRTADRSSALGVRAIPDKSVIAILPVTDNTSVGFGLGTGSLPDSSAMTAAWFWSAPKRRGGPIPLGHRALTV